MKTKLFLLSLLFCFFIQEKGQAIKLSPDAKITVLTCGSGNELYSIFGHTALYVEDTVQGIDLVFNYGTFDFNTKHFYLKYIKGLLPYQLSITSYDRFLAAYEYEDRTVYAQTLALDSLSKQNIMDALEENYLPKNRTYLYNFLFDNCTTRVRDIIQNNTDGAINWQLTNEHLSFWNLLDQYLNYTPWSQWGIHTILGQSGNKEATPYQYLFLPNYFMEGLQKASYRDTLLAPDNRLIYQSSVAPTVPAWYTAPYTVFSVVVALLSFCIIAFKNNRLLNWVSSILFILTGLLGYLIIFLMFFTLHPITAPNWNILWANPLNLFLPIFTLRHILARWMQIYLTCYGLLLFITIILWFFLYPAVSLSSLAIIVFLILLIVTLKRRKRASAE